MKHITDNRFRAQRPTAVTIGNFDGLHQGHRALIHTMAQEAEALGLEKTVLTFSPHPVFLFHQHEISYLILSPREKAHMMEQLGVELYVEQPFDREFAAQTPEEFVDRLLVERLNAKVVVVGENYRFGRKQSGNAAILKELCQERGIQMIAVPAVTYEGERVSSTRVREALKESNLELANRLLGSPYFILGDVAEGKRLGRTIGFPTVNIWADPVKLFPRNGVYATRTLYDGKMYSGVTNVGLNPTVHGTAKIVETYLFDFQKMIYGEELLTYFFDFIRPEQKFPSVEALQSMIRQNAQDAADYFASPRFDFWREHY